MNYELAKQLKETGFNQIQGFRFSNFVSPITSEQSKNIEPGAVLLMKDNDVYIPTLSELIEACGKDFRLLILHTTFIKKLQKPWEAVPNKRNRPECKSKNGETPEIAVALLWLELNK